MEKHVWELACEGCKTVKVVECPADDAFKAITILKYDGMRCATCSEVMVFRYMGLVSE